jgi:hypothetical protein
MRCFSKKKLLRGASPPPLVAEPPEANMADPLEVVTLRGMSTDRALCAWRLAGSTSVPWLMSAAPTACGRQSGWRKRLLEDPDARVISLSGETKEVEI